MSLFVNSENDDQFTSLFESTSLVVVDVSSVSESPEVAPSGFSGRCTEVVGRTPKKPGDSDKGRDDPGEDIGEPPTVNRGEVNGRLLDLPLGDRSRFTAVIPWGEGVPAAAVGDEVFEDGGEAVRGGVPGAGLGETLSDFVEVGGY